jgi:hypothetical protein
VTNSQSSWQDWTKSTKASDLEKVRAELEQIKKWQRTHAGTDFSAAGIDFPHPSQRVRVLTFFEGNGRLDQTGIQFVQTDTNPPPAITVVSDQFYDSPELVVPRFIIQSNVYSGSLPNSYFMGMVTADGSFGVSGSGAPDQSVYLEAGSGNSLVFATLFVVSEGTDVTGWWLNGGPLSLFSDTSDPAAIADSMLWYRSDLDRFRARANGVTENLAYESDIPTSSNVQPYAAKTTTYTTTNADGVISVDATSASFTVTLVSASGNAGLTQTFKKINAANVVTIDANSTQTIDGVTTYALSAQWSWVTLVSNGSNWLITGAG